MTLSAPPKRVASTVYRHAPSGAAGGGTGGGGGDGGGAGGTGAGAGGKGGGIGGVGVGDGEALQVAWLFSPLQASIVTPGALLFPPPSSTASVSPHALGS